MIPATAVAYVVNEQQAETLSVYMHHCCKTFFVQLRATKCVALMQLLAYTSVQ